MNQPNQSLGILQRISQWSRIYPPMIVFLAGLIISFAIFYFVRRELIQDEWRQFQIQASNHSKTVQHGIGEIIGTIRSIGGLYAASNEIDRSEFQIFADQILERFKTIQALAWIPRVPESKRSEYENSARLDGFPQFEFLEQSDTGELARASRRKEYYPVFFIEPYDGNEKAMMFDLGSSTKYFNAFRKAQDLDRIVATSRVELVQESGQQFGFLIFLPIYKKGSLEQTVELRRDSLKGFVSGVFRIGPMLDSFLKLSKQPNGLDIYVYDMDAPPEDRFLHFYPSEFHQKKVRPLSEAEIRREAYLESELTVADRRWKILFRPVEGASSIQHWIPWAGLLVGFGLTLALTLYLKSTISRTEVIERLVSERTDELSAANEKLEAEIISHERAERALEQRMEEQQSLSRVLQQISGEMNLEAILTNVLSEGARLMGTTRASITILDDHTEGPRLFVSQNIPRSFMEELDALPTSHPLARAYFDDPSLISHTVIPNLPSHPNFGKVMERAGHQVMAAFPIRRYGRNIGILVFYWTSNHELGDHQIGLGEMLTNQTSIAIGKTKLFAEKEDRAKRLTIMLDVVKRMTHGLDLDQILDAISSSAAELFEGEAGFRLLEGEYLVRASATPGALKTMKKERLRLGESIGGKVAQTGEPIVVEDLKNDLRVIEEHRDSILESSFKALVVVPMKLEGRTLGTLNIHRGENRPFSEEDVQLATSLADHAAVALETARLHEDSRKSLELFRSVVDDNADAIILQDSDRKIFHWNAGAEMLYGYTEEEAIGKEISLIFPPDNLEWEKRGAPIFKEARSLHFEGVRCRKDSSLVPVSITASPIKSETGNVIGLCAVHKDLTEQKRVEKELKISKEAAEAAAQAKSEFLANMSHEIRTPMNGVIGMTGFLLDTDLDDQQRDYAKALRNSGESLLEIINDILDYSKIEAGKLSIEPVSFDLQETVEEALELQAFRADEKGINLVLEFSPDVPARVIGDPGRIRQILINLVGNAIKFTHEGYVLLRVEKVEHENLAGNFRFAIEDTGIGIEESKIETLFDKFTQADSSTTRQFGGTGLGLAICKQLSELMGGAIGATSQQGQGSTFWFTLDLEVDTRAPIPPITGADLDGLRVLIVDDIRVNQRILEEQVKRWGMRPTSCFSGEEALLAMREAHEKGDSFQIAILDYQMPVMNGEELARQIKSDSALRETVLILLTSSGRRGDANCMKEAGFAGYLTKPWRESVLNQITAAAWNSRHSGASVDLITRYNAGGTVSATPKRATDNQESIEARVLVAEDNQVNQMVARKMLEKMGCQVDIASNGKEALNILDEASYDIVFMDCQMPEMSGYEATRAIRRKEEGLDRRIPIVAMTAHAMEKAREECLEAGMDDYVSKPVNPDVLKNALKRWLGKEEVIAATLSFDSE